MLLIAVLGFWLGVHPWKHSHRWHGCVLLKNWDHWYHMGGMSPKIPCRNSQVGWIFDRTYSTSNRSLLVVWIGKLGFHRWVPRRHFWIASFVWPQPAASINFWLAKRQDHRMVPTANGKVAICHHDGICWIPSSSESTRWFVLDYLY